MSDLDTRFLETMAEYDAIEDETTVAPAASRIMPVSPSHPYTLKGVHATDSTRGIVIDHGQKTVRK